MVGGGELYIENIHEFSYKKMNNPKKLTIWISVQDLDVSGFWFPLSSNIVKYKIPQVKTRKQNDKIM